MLTGTLDDFTLSDVLRLIAGAGRTGGLDVTRAGGGGSLYFRDGTVSSAAPRYARRTGAASPTGAIEDLTFDLMRWTRGEFTWTPGTASLAGGEADVDVDDLLREVSRRLEELAEIQTLVPSEESILAMAPQPPEGAVQINITPAEWRVLVLVDGHRTVAEIAEATDLDDLEAMKLLYGLASAGLVAADAALPLQEASDTADTADMSDMSDTAREETYSANGAVAFGGTAALAEARATAEAPPTAETPAPAGVAPAADEVPAPEAAEAPEAPATEEVSVPAAAEAPEAPATEEVSVPAAAEAPEAPADETPAPAEEPAWDIPAPPGEPDPFLAELVEAASSPFDGLDALPDLQESAAVDRSTAARELAGLFDDVEPGRTVHGISGPPAPNGQNRIPRRVEDDDQVTRGLISRLIDGVKGL